MTHTRRPTGRVAAAAWTEHWRRQDDEDGPAAWRSGRARVFGNKPLRGTLPDNELNQELLFKFLLSEIAGQRGNLQLAAQGYLEMAKTTRDPRLAKRATEIAAYGRLQNLALEAASLWLELDKNNPQARQTWPRCW